MRIIVINSSPRPGRLSHTTVLLEAVQEHLAASRPSWEWDHVRLWGLDINACDGNGRCFRRDGCVFQDDAEDLIERMTEADGIVLASPNYSTNVNSTMMRFIERTTRLSHRRLLTGKGALAVSTSASPVEAGQAAEYLRRVLGSYGASVVQPFNAGSPFGAMDYDYATSEWGPLLRESVDAFIAAVEDPAGNVPDERFGIDIRQALRDNPEVVKRLFRSDDRYFRRTEAAAARGDDE